jgi:hypothetical protein
MMTKNKQNDKQNKKNGAETKAAYGNPKLTGPDRPST